MVYYGTNTRQYSMFLFTGFPDIWIIWFFNAFNWLHKSIMFENDPVLIYEKNQHKLIHFVNESFLILEEYFMLN